MISHRFPWMPRKHGTLVTVLKTWIDDAVLPTTKDNFFILD